MKALIVCSFLLIGFLANAQETPVTPFTNKPVEQPAEQDTEEEKKGFDPQRL